MPCTDGGVPYPPSREEELNAKAPAMLCALMTTITPSNLHRVLNRINFKEAGVTQAEILEWWELHQVADRARRLREGGERLRQELVSSARAKLTPDELAALGL